MRPTLDPPAAGDGRRMTTRELLAELEPLLDRALELATPAERSAWLATVRAGSPALAQELESLLAAEEELDARGFLSDSGGGEFERPAALFTALSLAGRRVGAYTLERPLGQGGMGTVWLARRSDGRYEGVAAVKLLKLALLDPVGAERFRREATALARLTHPNIARLLDAGVTENGQPYLVLEYIEGRRIDTYCDGQRLAPHRRIELFLQVLAAVGHAHTNLLVHRDIKPSNILVTADGTVKLLDFGIAKLREVEANAAEGAELTEVGGAALTPEYAAPEQVAGAPVTTATDVYALGVLLYVLLAGRHPTGEGCRSKAEYLVAVTSTEPPRLSAAVMMGAAADLATRDREEATRGVVRERLRRLYRGDLDNIVAKALKKEASERYATVAAFADDLTRYLRHEPVRARADSVRYRLGKFVRRNRTAVALAALAVVVLLAGLAGTITQARRATREAGVAQEQRDFALQQLSRAEAINELNDFVLTDAAPSGKPFTVGDLLARAEAIVDREHSEIDANRVEMLVALGQQYVSLDEHAKARRLLDRAYQLSRALRERSTRARASCAFGGVVGKLGEPDAAERLVSEGLAELPDQPQYVFPRIFCLSRGSEAARGAGHAAAGIERAESARRLLARVHSPSPMLEVRVLLDVAESYREVGRLRDAEPVYREAYARLTASGRGNTQMAGTLLNDWALALNFMGRPREAEQLFREAIRISSADGGEAAVSPMLLNNYARTLGALARTREAVHYAEEAYAGGRRAGNDVVTNQALIMRLNLYSKLGQLDRAEQMLAELEPRLRKALPPGHYAFATVMDARAALVAARGNLDSALVIANRAVAMATASEQGALILAVAVRQRADLEVRLGRSVDAVRDASKAVELQKSKAPPGLPSVSLGLAYLTLGRALRANGETERAQQAFASALENLTPTLGPEHPDTRAASELVGRTVAAAPGEKRE